MVVGETVVEHRETGGAVEDAVVAGGSDMVIIEPVQCRWTYKHCVTLSKNTCIV